MTSTLHTYDHVGQGSEAWHALRCGVLTASVIGTIVTPSTKKPAANMQARSLAALLAAERITGWVDETFTSDDMLRGHLDEPEAINAYTKHTGSAVRITGFMARDFDSFRIGFSPDGLVGDDGFVECKSRQPKKHLQTIVADEVPAENIAQVQAGLLVSGRDWCDYISYAGGMRLWVKRVEADPEWQSALLDAACTFEAAVEEMVAAYHVKTLGMPMTERTTYDRIEF